MGEVERAILSVRDAARYVAAENLRAAAGSASESVIRDLLASTLREQGYIVSTEVRFWTVEEPPFGPKPARPLSDVSNPSSSFRLRTR